MRKKFLLFALVPVIILFIVVYIFHNRWIESGLELAGEKAVGARVEIDNLTVTFSPLGITWDKIQVANPNKPWFNIFETNKVTLGLDFAQLLRGKYIVNEVTVDELIIGTKRKTFGGLSKEEKENSGLAIAERSFSYVAKNAFDKIVNKTPLFDLVKLKDGFNPDSLISILDIKSVAYVDTLKLQLNSLTSEWNGIQTDFEVSKLKVLDIEKQITAINPNELKNAQNILAAITTVDNSIKTINEISKTVTTRSSTVQMSITSAVGAVGKIDNIVKDDFQRLKDMARLPSINTQGIAELLVGTEMYKRAMSYLYWVDQAKAKINEYTPEPEYEKPARFEGQDIEFPTERSFPKFWIKKISFTGGTAKGSESAYIRADGTALNITDNQDVTSQPVTINIGGTANNMRSLRATALFDRRNKADFDKYTATLSGVPVAGFSLGKSDFLPTQITDAVMKTELSISVPGNKIDGTISFNLKNMKMNFERPPANIGEQLVQETLKGINELNISLRMWNTKGTFDVALATDLDEKITKRFTEVLGAEFNKLLNDLKQKFDQKVQSEINKFKVMYQAKISEYTSKLGDYQSLIGTKLTIVDDKKKELEARLEKIKSGFVEDKLKDIFKKK